MMELAHNGALIDYFVKGMLPIQVVRRFARQIILGMDWLRVNNLAHRDIKGDNVFIDCDANIKIGDMGTVRHPISGDRSEETNADGHRTVAWNGRYMAPERLKVKRPDCWEPNFRCVRFHVTV